MSDNDRSNSQEKPDESELENQKSADGEETARDDNNKPEEVVVGRTAFDLANNLFAQLGIAGIAAAIMIGGFYMIWYMNNDAQEQLGESTKQIVNLNKEITESITDTIKASRMHAVESIGLHNERLYLQDLQDQLRRAQRQLWSQRLELDREGDETLRLKNSYRSKIEQLRELLKVQPGIKKENNHNSSIDAFVQTYDDYGELEKDATYTIDSISNVIFTNADDIYQRLSDVDSVSIHKRHKKGELDQIFVFSDYNEFGPLDLLDIEIIDGWAVGIEFCSFNYLVRMPSPSNWSETTIFDVGKCFSSSVHPSEERSMAAEFLFSKVGDLNNLPENQAIINWDQRQIDKAKGFEIDDKKNIEGVKKRFRILHSYEFDAVSPVNLSEFWNSEDTGPRFQRAIAAWERANRPNISWLHFHLSTNEDVAKLEPVVRQHLSELQQCAAPSVPGVQDQQHEFALIEEAATHLQPMLINYRRDLSECIQATVPPLQDQEFEPVLTRAWGQLAATLFYTDDPIEAKIVDIVPTNGAVIRFRTERGVPLGEMIFARDKASTQASASWVLATIR